MGWYIIKCLWGGSGYNFKVSGCGAGAGITLTVAGTRGYPQYHNCGFAAGAGIKPAGRGGRGYNIHTRAGL